MSAHRPRKTGPLEHNSIFDVLLSGAQSRGSGWLVERHNHIWRPPTDVYETEDLIVVQVEIAGVRQEDFSVSLLERRLTISGVRNNASPHRRVYHQMEVYWGEFRTEVELPSLVNESGIEAKYSDGFLRVVLPKQKPQQVNIK